MKTIPAGFLGAVLILLAPMTIMTTSAQTWTPDNGNGTFSNPLFYDEFSDPDLIRVGEDYYLTGTTMHAMPGHPVLHSKDLINWKFLSYAVDRLDFGPAYRLEEGKQIYGQGIWAPAFRYHEGTFYIFSNVRGQPTQIFSATNPAGPWKCTAMKRGFHDLSILFDDDGKVYVVWGGGDIHLAQLNDRLDDILPGSERVIIPPSAGMGEGSHFYKIDGKYYITSAKYPGTMPCARADKPEGPYEINPAISGDEDFGIAKLPMHQGGIVNTPTGEWWGFSMMDYNSLGRLTGLSPVTWVDGWPYFGLPGNLGRSPRTWVKPNTTTRVSPLSVPYQRSDDFSGAKLQPVWQWNHVPDDAKWSLTERPGFLRLHSLSAPDFWHARNTLTQRSIGPESTPTAELDTSGMKPGDVAGLGLLNFPYAWIGVKHQGDSMTVEQFDAKTGKTARVPIQAKRVWLRARCDFYTEKARFSYSTDGKTFAPLGDEFTMVFQLKTFQGVRYSLFHYNTGGMPGGYADFDGLTVGEAYPRGLRKPIPIDRTITLSTFGDGLSLVVKDGGLSAVPVGDSLANGPSAQFKVVDRGLGRVALQSRDGFISVAAQGNPQPVTIEKGKATDKETFQWIETPHGDLVLLSLVTHRYLQIAPNGTITVDNPGPKRSRSDGSCLKWEISAVKGSVR